MPGNPSGRGSRLRPPFSGIASSCGRPPVPLGAYRGRNEVAKVLKVSYSGIRGIVGQDLTPAVAYGFTLALGRFLAGRKEPPLILVARDNRPSGPELRQAVLAALAT